MHEAFASALASLSDDWSAVPLLDEQAQQLKAKVDAGGCESMTGVYVFPWLSLESGADVGLCEVCTDPGGAGAAAQGQVAGGFIFEGDHERC